MIYLTAFIFSYLFFIRSLAIPDLLFQNKSLYLLKKIPITKRYAIAHLKFTQSWK